jgi:hydrogenase expression/formation protein HypC
MCVATPMRLVKIDGDEGIVEEGGVRRKISLSLLGSAAIGDYLLIHAGFAIAIVDEEEAKLSIEAIEACSDEGDEPGA